MESILIVKMGSTFPHMVARWGDFDDWIRNGLGRGGTAVDVCRPYAGETLPAPEQPAAVVVTGSHAMVTDAAEWSEATARWLQRIVAAGTPVLGICYGHQLLARAAGGRVGDNPGGPQFGTVDLRLHASAADDPLFGGLPAAFRAQVSHSQNVQSLPPGAVLLASAAHDPHQAFRCGARAWGVQFHPEFSLEILRAYIAACADLLQQAGCSPEGLSRSAAPTAVAAGLLERFAAIAAAG